jgi:hypothetical protein
MEKLQEYTISLIKERNEIFEKAKQSVSLSLTSEIYKANAITHGLNIILDFFESENLPTDFIPTEFQKEREHYKYLLNNFNTPEVQKQIQPIIDKLQNEKKL